MNAHTEQMKKIENKSLTQLCERLYQENLNLKHENAELARKVESLYRLNLLVTEADGNQ